MRVTIIQSSRAGNWQVMQEGPHGWKILRQFPRCGMLGIEDAIRYAAQQDGFRRETLSKTVGSWDGAMFAPHPRADASVLANFRALREEGLESAGKPNRKTHAQKRGAKYSQGPHQSRAPIPRVV